MTTLPDLLYVALFAVALPLWDYLVSWPAVERQFEAHPARARKRLWVGAIAYPWALVTVGTALSVMNDRSWSRSASPSLRAGGCGWRLGWCC